MLTTSKLSVLSPKGSALLTDISISFPSGNFTALVGPSGCGKSTLLKGILGQLPTQGELKKPANARLGFVPQFSIAFPQLTVEENLSYAQKLTGPFDVAAIQETLDVVGLLPHQHKKVNLLSGGQLRRLGLALELITKPEILFCDEVTSGLDPVAEEEILRLLKKLSREKGLSVVCILHNLEQLCLFDHVVVLKGGTLAASGAPMDILRHYGLNRYQELYPRLDLFPKLNNEQTATVEHTPIEVKVPSVAKQTAVLLHRRWKLFFADKGNLFLTLAMSLGFPLLVIIFAMKGLPQLQNLSLTPQGSFIDQLRAQLDAQKSMLAVGSLASGLIIFQIILLTLIGSNNGAKEIATERHILSKEKLSGLRPISYLYSKLLFLGSLSLFQGLWMCVLVKYVCKFPGSIFIQAPLLIGVVLAMSFTTLAISAWSGSGEKSSLLSTYLVGFQLPLSGIVLALPSTVEYLFKPGIIAFWGWSGYMSSMKTERVYDAVVATAATHPQTVSVVFAVVIAHILVSIAVTYAGVKRAL